MKNTYSVGDQTKSTILSESKKLFYSKGYTETTYSDISIAANVNRALIPYHFKNKQILGIHIYSECITNFTSALDNMLDINQFSSDLIGVIHIMASYRLLRNYNYCRFLFEVVSDDSSDAWTEFDKEMIQTCFKDKKTPITDSEMDMLCRLGIGMKKELIHILYESNNKTDASKLINMQIIMLLSYTGFTRKKIDELLDAAQTILDLIDIQVTNNFNIELSYK